MYLWAWKMVERGCDLFSFVGCFVFAYPCIEILIGVETANVAKLVVIVFIGFVFGRSGFCECQKV